MESKNLPLSKKATLRIVLAALFAFVLALGLSACGKKDASAPAPADEPAEPAVAVASVDQVAFKDLAFEVTDYGEDSSNQQTYRYLYTLTGTIENNGDLDLAEVNVSASYTDVSEDEYGDPVRTEGNDLTLYHAAASYGLIDSVFYGVKAHESRPFTYLFSTDAVMEDPVVVATSVSTTPTNDRGYLADESQIEVTFNPNKGNNGEGDSYWVSIKNNTDKLFQSVTVYMHSIDYYGSPYSKDISVYNLRPGSELHYEANNLDIAGEDGFGINAIFCVDDTENPAVPLEEEFGYEPTTDEDGYPAFIIENKTGHYLSQIYLDLSWTDDDGYVRCANIMSGDPMKPGAKQLCTLGYGDYHDVKLMDITYDIDEEKESSVAES